MVVLCHGFATAQALTNGLPAAQSGTPAASPQAQTRPEALPEALPDDPGQEALPVAQPEAAPAGGVPVMYKADRQHWAGNVLTLEGVEDFHYRDYVFRADKVVWHRDTDQVEAEGNLQVTGGPEDIDITASHGDMRPGQSHSAVFRCDRHDGHAVDGQERGLLHCRILSLFARGCCCRRAKGSYRVVDGSMTNCRLPHPDWQLHRALDCGIRRKGVDQEHVFQIPRCAAVLSALPAPSGR